VTLWYWPPPALLRTVILNLVTPPDEAIKGVLWESRGPWLRVRQATALKEGQPPTEIDGEVLIERRNVSFIQVLTPLP
jgi:hypothetical protein